MHLPTQSSPGGYPAGAADVNSGEPAVLSLSRSGTITDCSDTAAAFLGRSREALVGRNIGELTVGLSRPEMRAQLDITMKRGRNTYSAAFEGPANEPVPARILLVREEAAGEPVLRAHLRRVDVRQDHRLDTADGLLAQVHRAAGIGSWEWNIATGEVYWTDTVSALFGMGREEFAGQYEDLLEAIHPQDRSRVVEKIEAALEGRGQYYAEHRVQWPDGSIHWLVSAGDVGRDADGSPVRMLGIAQDITRYHDAISALQQSQQRYTEAEQVAGLGSWELDIPSAMAVWSDEAYRLLGYAPHSVPASYQKFLDAVHPDDRDEVLNAVERALEGRTPEYRVEHRVNLPDGEERHVLQQGRVDFTADGHPRRMIGTTLDVTDRVRVEKALQQSHEQWEHIMNYFEDPVYVVDLDDRVVRANRAFFERTGRSPGEVIGSRITDIMHPNGETIPCPVCRARGAREDALVTMEADHPDNPFGRPMEVMVRMVRDEAGTPTAILMALRDLSRTREKEDELKRLNAHIRVLMESAGEGIYGVDAEGRCTFINTAALNLLGYAREDVMGEPMHELVHCGFSEDEQHSLTESIVFKAMREGRGVRADNEVLWRRDGSAFPAEYSAYPTTEDKSVTGAVVVFRDVTEARALTEKMDYLATHDPLTGLVNRREFEQRLQLAVESARQYGKQHIVCYLDLDQFKVVNDTCGHVAGDELLRMLSSMLHERIRHTDVLSRLGGDEFGVLLEDCSIDGALRIVGDLSQAVQDFRFSWEEKTFSLGVSAGVTAIDNATEDIGSAMSQADAACYMAKESGRNRIHVYTRDDADLVQRHGEMQWVARLQQALAADEFCLRSQPIVATHGGLPGKRLEILVGLCPGEGEMIPPGAFLPAAERYNLMPALDRWVVGATFDWLVGHPETLDELEMCFINLSGVTVSDENFHAHLLDVIRRSGLPGAKLCFEMTETAAVTNLTAAIHFIKEIKSLGCRFALDDFGSGMSSFGYLKELPVDYLKIDGSFVKDLLTDPVDRAMVTAIRDIGHVMGIGTIAEFVETEAVRRALGEIGVDYVQGYGIARPERIR